MLGLNKVFIMGNLTRDPELKYTPNGQAVASFGVATNRRWTTPEGERREEAEFHNMVVWGRAAETINQYVKKGNPLFVEGRLKTNNWEGPDGVKRSRTEIIVDNFQFLGSGGGGGQQQQSGGYQPQQQQAPANNFGDNAAQATPPIESAPPAQNDAAPTANTQPTDTPPNDNPFADDNSSSDTPAQSNPDDISIEDIPF